MTTWMIDVLPMMISSTPVTPDVSDDRYSLPVAAVFGQALQAVSLTLWLNPVWPSSKRPDSEARGN